ncbi:hypothetical protein [Pseudanabaena mucicola]|uniref:Uncharacterized protein n=1 Tax=Pseudanabaena mucicola FACHB-723 TaxID=2692860 RepID=A0ABR7ZZS3_9CYAN|nr:hypothetical protein [Pseudanabaena mucicola]MBD2189458.1 hypothetical protein [Pseudanabaena mucicola FACHB-723]
MDKQSSFPSKICIEILRSQISVARAMQVLLMSSFVESMEIFAIAAHSPLE